MKFVVACGGTGGHAFPGLAVAEELRCRGHEIVVWDSGREVESSVMRCWTGEVFSTGARQLRPRNALPILSSVLRCRREMRREKPDALLAMGSYSSLPPVLAAKSCRVPVVLHEANTVPGKAVEFLSRFARSVAISFDLTRKCLKHPDMVRTGLPVRMEITRGQRFGFIPPDAFVVFVTGGSQGAHAVNLLACEALTLLKRELDARPEPHRPLYVIHQTGVKDEGQVMAAYANLKQPARVHAFEREMADAFASADIVIARAGASTCFELAATGKPALLIPLPTAMRDHQRYNAEAFASAGAADMAVQDKLSARGLFHHLLAKYDRPSSLASMAERMRGFSVPDAASRVADLVERAAAGR